MTKVVMTMMMMMTKQENKCKDGEVLMADGNCGTPMTDIKNDDDDSMMTMRMMMTIVVMTMRMMTKLEKINVKMVKF